MTEASARENIFADMGNRAGAWLLDLFLVMFAAAAVGDVFGRAFPLLVILYFVGLPVSPLQGTLGKWICRIKLCNRRGERLGWRASFVRAGAQLLWCVIPVLLSEVSSFGGMYGTKIAASWCLLFALPWAPAGFRQRRESAFDLLAGSLVVRYNAAPQSIAGATGEAPGILALGGTVLLCAMVGVAFNIMITTQRHMGLRARIAYAIEQTMPLREKIEEFQAAQRRWPTAAEAGLPEWTPYRDGGGYRMQADGSIVITFSVMPELKGHSIAFRPARAGEGIRWECKADPGFDQAYLPSNCRSAP